MTGGGHKASNGTTISQESCSTPTGTRPNPALLLCQPNLKYEYNTFDVPVSKLSSSQIPYHKNSNARPVCYVVVLVQYSNCISWYDKALCIFLFFADSPTVPLPIPEGQISTT